jgi:hypothetical protein
MFVYKLHKTAGAYRKHGTAINLCMFNNNLKS